MTDEPKKKASLYAFGAFWIVGVVLGIAAVLRKESVSEAALRIGGLVFFGLFFVTISATEICTGEIRTSINGPAMCTKEEHPIRFWILVGSQLVFGTVLLGFSLVRP